MKFTWDPEYQAAKKKTLEDRNRSRDEFAKAKVASTCKEERDDGEDVPAEDVEHDNPKNEDAMMVYSENVLEYVNVLEYNDVLENDFAARHVDARLRNYVKVVEYFLKIFRPLFLLVALLWFPGVMSMEAPEENQCPVEQTTREEPVGLMFGWIEGAVLTALSVLWLTGFMLGKACGWRHGREHRLRERHIAYERVSDKVKELETQNERLKRNIAEYGETSYNFGRGLVSLRDENYDIAEYVMFLENKVEEKQEEIQQLQGKNAQLREQLIRGSVAIHRAINELLAHKQSCPMRSSIWICRAGRVWHTQQDCRALGHGSPVEWNPCTFCASRSIPPYINDLQGRNLLDDLTDWMDQFHAEDHLSAGGS